MADHQTLTAAEHVALLEGRYNALNAVERGIVDNWIKGGMSKKAAVDMLYRDLADAAEEDGYDGP